MHPIDKLIKIMAQASAWLLLPLVLVMLANIILRYCFSVGFIPLQESVIYLHVLVLMLAIPYGLKINTHVRLDIIHKLFSARQKKAIELLGFVFFLLPVCAIVIYFSWNYVELAWQIKEGSNQPGGLPFVYLLKTLLIIMPALLLLQGFSQMISLLSNSGD